MGDRLDWLKEKIVKNLNVPESSFDELLQREGPDGKSYWAGLNTFLDSDSQHEAVVVFFAEEEAEDGGEQSPSLYHSSC